MSTNYYITRAGEIIEHIGKDSGGTTFTFQGSHHATVKAWVDRLSNLAEDEAIEAESRYVVSADDFWADVGRSLQGINLQEWAISAGATNGPLAAMSYLRGEVWQDGPFTFDSREFC